MNNKKNTKISDSKVNVSLEKNKEDIIVKDSNDLFFEKFDKSKKDFKNANKKNKLLARRDISNKLNAIGFSKRLEDGYFVSKIYLFLLLSFFITVGFSIAIFSVLFPYSNAGTYAAGNVNDIWSRVAYVQYPNFALSSIILSSIVFIVLPAPYLYLMATWFVGINQVTKNKHFIMTNIFLTIISIIIFIVVLILSTIFFVAVSAPQIQLPAIPLP